MKVLVFPVLLAIAIITGPAKTDSDKAPANAAVKPATTTIARTELVQLAKLAPYALATPTKDAVNHPAAPARAE
ncbi:hypothetical protein [Hymenobacter psychrophilus]|uniref:Uncharacterized protein n=1 Tax=Hymenobacter psychrophilus TaxID=651662 RepID=A0A1H3HXS3_9BACT|nr:hypothetical protein [Hymenobacter psychrophilus]SDY20045.1 hypothetical protein SAMN04488069_106189 [Hymenobacter psychrophilus]